MNYWLHRISHHAEVSYPLLDKNILTIGFSDFANQGFINTILNDDSREKRWSTLEKGFDETWGCRPRTRYNLWRFIDGLRGYDERALIGSSIIRRTSATDSSCWLPHL